MDKSSSPKGTVNATDWSKGTRGMLITLLAAVGVTFFSEILSMIQTGQIEFGVYDYMQPLVISVLGFVLEMIRRYKTDYSA